MSVLYIFVLSEKNSHHACYQNVPNLYLDKEYGAVHVQNNVYMQYVYICPHFYSYSSSVQIVATIWCHSLHIRIAAKTVCCRLWRIVSIRYNLRNINELKNNQISIIYYN